MSQWPALWWKLRKDPALQLAVGGAASSQCAWPWGQLTGGGGLTFNKHFHGFTSTWHQALSRRGGNVAKEQSFFYQPSSRPKAPGTLNLELGRLLLYPW